jgi:hypothetical protein
MSPDFEPFLRSTQTPVAYNAARILKAPDLAMYYERLLHDEKIASLVSGLAAWPGPVLASHKSAQQFFHKLAFIADLGLSLEYPGVRKIIDKVLSCRDEQGIPCLPMAIGQAYGGTGEERSAWALCDAPTTMYAVLKLGFMDDGLMQAIHYLSGKTIDRGWPCVVSKELGTWHGPGKKTDPCPYATLIMTKLLLQSDPVAYADGIRHGAACLLDLWEHSLDQHPYIFYMGNDFRKLKLPFIWYDILHVVEVLSQVEFCWLDGRFLEMMEIINAREVPGTGFVPESVYQVWKDWDFGQKKKPSEWMAFCVARINSRKPARP